jgi:hypothetical protein
VTLPAQWPAPFDKDLLKFKKAYQVGSDDASIQNAIMQHGSFTAQMNVYLCSPHLRLWRRKWQKPFWRAANSWNRDWGVNGTFKPLKWNLQTFKTF